LSSTALIGLTLVCALRAGPFGAAGAASANAAGLVVVELILWYAAGRVLGLRTSVFGR
jgi:hypothetical protein